MGLRIAAARARADGLEVAWRDRAEPVRFSWLWLRDHAAGPESLNPDTLQRRVDTFALPAGLRARSVRVDDDGAAVEVAWPGAPAVTSRYAAAFLAAMAGLAGPAPGAGIEPVPWDAAALGGAPPAVPYAAVMADEAGLSAWLEALARHGACLVPGTPVSAEATRELAERIGYLRNTIFGDFWDFSADLKHGDTAYTTEAIGLHTDGTYSHDAPGLQMLHCLEFDGMGGESVLADGFFVAGRLRARDPEAFRVLTEVEVPGRYIEPGVHLEARRPVLRLDAGGRVVQVSFNNYDRAPFWLPGGRMAEFYRALGGFHALLEDPAHQVRFRLQPGAVLVFDNWRVLHARTAYTGQRRMCGCYLNREDFESRLRVLRAPRGAPQAAGRGP